MRLSPAMVQRKVSFEWGVAKTGYCCPRIQYENILGLHVIMEGSLLEHEVAKHRSRGPSFSFCAGVTGNDQGEWKGVEQADNEASMAR